VEWIFCTTFPQQSTAFSEAEKQALGIVGLVPDLTETEDVQLSGC